MTARTRVACPRPSPDMLKQNLAMRVLDLVRRFYIHITARGTQALSRLPQESNADVTPASQCILANFAPRSKKYPHHIPKPQRQREPANRAPPPARPNM